MSTNETSLNDRIQQLEARCEKAEFRALSLETRYSLEARKLRILGGIAAVMVVTTLIATPNNRALAQGYGESLHQLITDVTTLKTEMLAVQNKTQFMSVNNKTTLFTGCNLQVVNGLGATNGNPSDPLNTSNDYVTNGLGNIIIGYNYSYGQKETGSHNLILGDENSYSSYGGIVSGLTNTINGAYSSVYGGQYNHSNGDLSVVSGGYQNDSVGVSSTIIGGELNVSTGFASSILGGNLNTSGGIDSSVSGGSLNSSSADYTSVTGGEGNTANNNFASVSGGEFNVASGEGATVTGGANNTSQGHVASVTCGQYNSSDGFATSILGGKGYTLTIAYSHNP